MENVLFARFDVENCENKFNLENKFNKIEEFKNSKISLDIHNAFPDAKLIDVKDEE